MWIQQNAICGDILLSTLLKLCITGIVSDRVVVSIYVVIIVMSYDRVCGVIDNLVLIMSSIVLYVILCM